MCITLVHDFHTEVGTVQHIGPSVHNMTLIFNNGLIEVEPVEVESHGADAEAANQIPATGHAARKEVK